MIQASSIKCDTVSFKFNACSVTFILCDNVVELRDKFCLDIFVDGS